MYPAGLVSHSAVSATKKGLAERFSLWHRRKKKKHLSLFVPLYTNYNGLGQRLTQNAATVTLQNSAHVNVFCRWGGEAWHRIISEQVRVRVIYH